MDNAIISIKPEYVEKILSGEKKVELRSRVVRIKPGTRLWIYATLPKGCIQAVARVERILSAHPEEIWMKHSHDIGISRKVFDAYLEGRRKVSAIELGAIQKIRPSISLKSLRKRVDSFHPPQFFNNLSSDSPTLDAIYQLIDSKHRKQLATSLQC